MKTDIEVLEDKVYDAFNLLSDLFMFVGMSPELEDLQFIVEEIRDFRVRDGLFILFTEADLQTRSSLLLNVNKIGTQLMGYAYGNDSLDIEEQIGYLSLLTACFLTLEVGIQVRERSEKADEFAIDLIDENLKLSEKAGHYSSLLGLMQRFRTQDFPITVFLDSVKNVTLKEVTEVGV